MHTLASQFWPTYKYNAWKHLFYRGMDGLRGSWTLGARSPWGSHDAHIWSVFLAQFILHENDKPKEHILCDLFKRMCAKDDRSWASSQFLMTEKPIQGFRRQVSTVIFDKRDRLAQLFAYLTSTNDCFTIFYKLFTNW